MVPIPTPTFPGVLALLPTLLVRCCIVDFFENLLVLAGIRNFSH